MNTKHLEYILEVYRCGSINKAAKYCYISQSHLSKIIKDVEQEIGFRIMHRSKSGLDFTNAGKLFIKSAEIMVAEYAKIIAIPENFTARQALSIACSPDSFLLHSFLDFEKQSPRESGSDMLKELGLREIMQHLISGECRLGIMSMFEQKEEKYAQLADKYDLELVPLKKRLAIIVVMNPSHPLAKQESVSVQDLARYPYAVDATVDYDDTLGVLNMDSNPGVLYVTGLSSMVVALKRNNYLTVEMATMKSYVVSQGLSSRPINDLSEHMGVYLLRHRKLPEFNRERDFIAFLKSKLDKIFPD